MKNGLSQQITLENSYNYDSVLCACVADVDFDGLNEIILGTYGQVTNFLVHHEKGSPGTYLVEMENMQLEPTSL